jgi:uncharacterized membrane protein
MAKWDDKHMYNWVGWMRSISALHKKVEDWCFIKYSFPRFMAFYLTLTFGSLLKYILIGLMAIPQTIEWVMANIIEVVDYLIVGNPENEDSRQFRTLLGVVMAFAFVLPYAITWGLPNLISEGIKKRKEKLESRQRMRDVITRDEVRERWGIAVPPPPQRSRGVKVKDFKPKYYVAPHIFNREHKTLFVSPGVYTRDEFVVVEEREGNVNRAYVRRVATQRRRQLESEEEGGDMPWRGIFR